MLLEDKGFLLELGMVMVVGATIGTIISTAVGLLISMILDKVQDRRPTYRPAPRTLTKPVTKTTARKAVAPTGSCAGTTAAAIMAAPVPGPTNQAMSPGAAAAMATLNKVVAAMTQPAGPGVAAQPQTPAPAPVPAPVVVPPTQGVPMPQPTPATPAPIVVATELVVPLMVGFTVNGDNTFIHRDITLKKGDVVEFAGFTKSTKHHFQVAQLGASHRLNLDERKDTHKRIWTMHKNGWCLGIMTEWTAKVDLGTSSIVDTLLGLRGVKIPLASKADCLKMDWDKRLNRMPVEPGIIQVLEPLVADLLAKGKTHTQHYMALLVTNDWEGCVWTPANNATVTESGLPFGHDKNLYGFILVSDGDPTPRTTTPTEVVLANKAAQAAKPAPGPVNTAMSPPAAPDLAAQLSAMFKAAEPALEARAQQLPKPAVQVVDTTLEVGPAISFEALFAAPGAAPTPEAQAELRNLGL